MKKVTRNLLIIFMLFMLADIMLGLIFQQILLRSPDGRYYKTNIVLNECTDPMLIFGSSRAEENYVPFVFEDSLGLSCWNAGRGGQSLPYWYAVSLGVLNRYTPEIVIINADSYFLALDLKDAFERAGFLRPFYYSNPEIRPIINNISWSERFLLKSRIYAYNSSFYYLLRPYMVKGIDGKPHDKGWKPRHGIIRTKNDELQIVSSDMPLNPQTVELFQEFVSNFTSRGCEVYVVLSPDYNCLFESTSTMRFIESMQDIVFLNMGKEKYILANQEFYIDHSHMNYQGAIEYSRHLSREIIKHKRESRDLLVQKKEGAQSYTEFKKESLTEEEGGR